MRHFSSLRDLIEVIDSFPGGWVYFNTSLSELENARFLVSEGRESVDLEQVESEGRCIPRVVHEQGMRPLLDVATLQDVVDLRRQVIPNATPSQYAEAIRHYVSEDEFLD